MFWKSRVDYKKVFASKKTIHEFLYGDASKTEAIIYGDDFIKAVANSQNAGLVDMVIAEEAAKGNIPSLMYTMMNLQIRFRDIDSQVSDRATLTKIKSSIYENMIRFCDLAMANGKKQDAAYHATILSVMMYNFLSSDGRKSPSDLPAHEGSALSECMSNAIDYGREYLSTKPKDPELVSGVDEKINLFLRLQMNDRLGLR